MTNISKANAIQILSDLATQVSKLEDTTSSNPIYLKWRRDINLAIANIFGENSSQANEIKESLQYLGGFNESSYVKIYSANTHALLGSMIDEVRSYWPDEKPPSETKIIENNIQVTQPSTRKIFVIHGHDSGTKETVARFLTTIGLEVIILHEQANQGRTIIEKFHDYSDVCYAVALFTPDDFGGLANSPDVVKPRARQNVVFEFGYFLGKLGRQNVCGLVGEGVELPSDYAGVLYLSLDLSGFWKFQLVKELKAAGLDIDANKAL